jgi:outer membrane protein, heavy metal efflux system
LITLLVSQCAYAQQWTLKSSVDQALSESPELKKAQAEIGARQADIRLSGYWPDPEVGFRVDNKLGKDDGTGGYDLSEVLIRQSIPVSRIKFQESAAEARLQAAHYALQFDSLQVQNRVSKAFHQLQLASAELSLAEKQLEQAVKLIESNTSSSGKASSQDAVVRYLTPLEKMRLTIIREEARQAAGSAEGKYKEALSEFVKLLGIDADGVHSVSELLPITVLPDINYLLKVQGEHAQLSSQQQEVLAANSNIDVARSSQMIDPSIGLSWSRDTFDTGRGDVYAIMFNLQIPISDRKNSAQSKATYQASQAKIELQLLERELKINLNQSYTHLNHVVEQAVEYKKKVLAPAKKMLELTQKGFHSGELNILSLVDANNTYYEARLSYLDLLYQARVELADVRLYAGQMITDASVQKLSSNSGDL